MTQADLNAYRHRLLDLLRRLGSDRSQLKDEALRGTGGEASGSLSDVPLHLGDLGSHEFEEELTLGLIENEEQLIEGINDALARIEQGTFGRCEACGKAVSRERLHALPYARHCVACARRLQGEANR
jgi:RNA polymerase-binding protein DksA